MIDEMNISDEGLEFLTEFEGFKSYPYLDIAGVPTIGYGTTYYPNGSKVTLDDKPITKEEALEIKLKILKKDFIPQLNKILEPFIEDDKINQCMFDAIVSFAYNVGFANFKSSSIYKYIKAGNKNKAADAFLLWNKYRDPKTNRLKVSKGLQRRRQREKDLFLS